MPNLDRKKVNKTSQQREQNIKQNKNMKEPGLREVLPRLVFFVQLLTSFLS